MREKRAVSLSGNAIEWLNICGRIDARVCPISESTLHRTRERLCQAAVTWLKDGARHTYASAHLAKDKSIELLLLQMGHKDPTMLWRHYYRSMSAADADRFWSIRPSGEK
jgi:integrase